MSNYNDSNLSRPTKNNETPPLPQHKRMALMGTSKVNGMKNPFGAEKGSTTNRIANDERKTY